MAGMKFEYDENGGKFYYFFLSFYALILLPTSYWLWPKPEKRKSAPHSEDTSNFERCRDKYQLLHANQPNRQRRARLTQIGIVIAWIILIILAYRVSLIETEYKDYDPFAILDVDREASVSEIKRAYRELSKKHHPDRGGDPEQFKEIAKAYKALTDEEAKENWQKYGNPDGPGVTHFGIALPKWLVDHQNSIFVLLIYAGVFMIVLPVIICVWWRKSARYAGDHILIDTIQIYSAFLAKTSTISIKRAIMILSAAAEFSRIRNPLIIDRPSDNIELPKLIREISDVQEKTKEGPFQAPYSIKARTLIHAHLRRLDTLSDDLQKDTRYILKRSTYLINEMINIAAQLVTFGHMGQVKNPPKLEAIENIMKLSPMIVQGLLNNKSPLLQLPHITESHLRFFETKKRTIRSIRQFIAVNDEERRSMLRSLTDEQYDDIMNVLSIYPDITMKTSWGVFDDENEHKITTGAVVTLTVHLHRENMSNLFTKDSPSNTLDDEINEEQIDDKENRDKTNGISKTKTNTPSKGWNNKSDKKKKKDKGKKKNQSTSSKSINKSSLQVTNKNQTKDSSDDDSSKHSHDAPLNSHQQPKEDSHGSDDDDDGNPVIEQTIAKKKSTKNDENEDDTFLEKFQQQQRKREKLETKEKISERVFCPFYPEIKQECWWLYVADKKSNSLISVPVYLCTLKDNEEVEIKFSAPKHHGHFDYLVVLRSDSYLGVDVTKELPLDVEAAEEVENNHPQWNFDEDEEATNQNAEDEEFATESDSDQD